MKRYSLIILVLLIISSIKSESCDDNISPESAKECFKLETSKEESDCCYLYVVENGVKKAQCQSITKEKYKEAKEEKKKIKAKGQPIDADIICNSSYFLKLSLLIILLFIF